MVSCKRIIGVNILLETAKKYYRVDRGKIYFLKFIFEGYDGIATLTTVDSGLGVVVIHVSPGCEEEVETVLQDLQNDIMIEPLKERGL